MLYDPHNRNYARSVAKLREFDVADSSYCGRDDRMGCNAFARSAFGASIMDSSTKSSAIPFMHKSLSNYSADAMVGVIHHA